MKKNIIYLFSITMVMLSIASCKKEGSGSGIQAVFSYVADGYKVNFTNFSRNSTEYSWDFGDGSGETSDKKAPTHIFKSKGDFLVSLTTKNGTESSTFIDTVSVLGPNIKIDGDFTDWEYVDYTYQNPAATTGTLLAVKTYASATDIYFYVEGTKDMHMALIDMYFDADNNPATGYFVGAYADGSGADYLAEGPATKDTGGSVFEHTGAVTAFTFNPVANMIDVMKFSDIKPVADKNVIEFSIKKSSIGNPKNSINFLLFDENSGYAVQGALPASPAKKFINVSLK
ncbi:PKD domain-containing protein [Pedobacter sp. SD-b]|uniref:PKD domain-containing protein n=1 Tax=Pedobacter segetis TaxID=2793069 RepID=A0ABS1BN72_9SPHI|nr:PKD domain-containing protein [Pedobacter segetis]MBK0383649.1 PKD domain-containing protein [Pedobacter segetis]